MVDAMDAAKLFTNVAAKYDRLGVEFFGPLAARVIELAEISAGDDVIDIGCGRGAVLFPAARIVGSRGSVVGIDIAPGMVEFAQQDAQSLGLGNVRVVLGDAAEPGLDPGSADVVVGSMSLFLMPAHEKAIAAFARLLRPGGRAVFSLPILGPPHGIWPAGTTAMQRVVDEVDGLSEMMASFRWSEKPGVLEDIFNTSGYTDIEILEETSPITAPSAEALVAWTRTLGARLIWDSLSAPAAERFERDLLAEAESLRTSHGTYRHDSAVRLALARRPSTT